MLNEIMARNNLKKRNHKNLRISCRVHREPTNAWKQRASGLERARRRIIDYFIKVLSDASQLSHQEPWRFFRLIFKFDNVNDTDSRGMQNSEQRKKAFHPQALDVTRTKYKILHASCILSYFWWFLGRLYQGLTCLGRSGRMFYE